MFRKCIKMALFEELLGKLQSLRTCKGIHSLKKCRGRDIQCKGNAIFLGNFRVKTFFEKMLGKGHFCRNCESLK